MNKYDELKKTIHNNERNKLIRKQLYDARQWYTIRSLLGNTWALFYIVLGARERGKSYSIMEYCIRQFKRLNKPFTWIRLTEASTKKMLNNNAAKLVDADLMRKYDLELTVKGNDVFDHGNKMCTVLALSTAHNDKGVALFDCEVDYGYNIILDEFQLEKSQKRTFDICYNLVVELENLVRSQKHNVRIFMIGNTTQEAADILAMFNFIPQEFGIYKLKSKRCVIDYIPNSKAYIERRKGTVGDILAGNTGNYTNKIDTDVTLVNKSRLYRPQAIIKFTKDKSEWFTIWDSRIIARYNGEKCKTVITMRRYIDDLFDPTIRDKVFELYDTRTYNFHNLITQKLFQYQLSLLKKQ